MAFDDNNPDALPDQLIAELKDGDSAPPLISGKVDRVVMQLAREQFAARAVLKPAKMPMWYALAASVLLAVLLLPDVAGIDPVDPGFYRDVDRSGQIDIADVLALARGGGPPVSTADLDAFAMRIVSLRAGVDAS